MSADRHHSSFDGSPLQVAVVGAGPAGRWLASELARRQVAVALVDPRIDKPWPNTYGVWIDELADLPQSVPMQRTFPRVSLRLNDQDPTLERAYGLIDNQAFQRQLDRRLSACKATSICGRVTGVAHGRSHSTLHLADGRLLKAQIVVDASGGAAALLRHRRGPSPAFQRAFGMVARFEGDPLQGRSMVLMDYRPLPGAPSVGEPTFLYGMHLGGDRYFVEETVLVTKERTDFDALRQRLERRLEHLGATVLSVEERERCHIPMGGPLPDFNQPLLGFGAASGLVHPATGYQMTRMLGAGPALARCLAQSLGAGLDRDQICRRAWQVLWPAALRQARLLLVFGRDVLLSFDRNATCRFFETFFALDDRDWRPYLSGLADHRQLASIMWRFFGAAPIGLRLALAGQALSSGPQVYRALRPSTSPGGIHG